jgi:hypothetical protein
MGVGGGWLGEGGGGGTVDWVLTAWAINVAATDVATWPWSRLGWILDVLGVQDASTRKMVNKNKKNLRFMGVLHSNNYSGCFGRAQPPKIPIFIPEDFYFRLYQPAPAG